MSMNGPGAHRGYEVVSSPFMSELLRQRRQVLGGCLSDAEHRVLQPRQALPPQVLLRGVNNFTYL